MLLYVLVNGEAEYSVSALAETLGSSRKAVHAAIKHLTTLGLLVVMEPAKGSRGGTYQARLQPSQEN